MKRAGQSIKCQIATLAVLLLMAQSDMMLAGTFRLPEGCSAYLTVQARGCRVSHHYTCAGDAEGEQWRVDIGEEGPYFYSKIDFEAQWLTSLTLPEQHRQTLLPNPADPASFTALTTTGRDLFDFGLVDDFGQQTQVRGFDQLTGRKVVIDGVELEETAYEMRETNPAGALVMGARGLEYIHRDWRLFFGGTSEAIALTPSEVLDRSPVRFDEPSDPGFLSDRPEFDCALQLSVLGGMR